MPWCSTGFSVATRKNGSGSGRVTPSAVTWRSSIGSRSAGCVRGVALLISSTRTTFAKTGPGTNSNSRRSWWYTETQVRSDGRRSGVACTLLNEPPMERATALARVVFPTPGTPSSSRLPPASRHITAARTAAVFPAMTRSTLATTRWGARAVSKPEGGAEGSPMSVDWIGPPRAGLERVGSCSQGSPMRARGRSHAAGASSAPIGSIHAEEGGGHAKDRRGTDRCRDPRRRGVRRLGHRADRFGRRSHQGLRYRELGGLLGVLGLGFVGDHLERPG